MPTYTQIGSAVTVGSGGAASIDFSSIPTTYTDLVVKISGRTNLAAVSDFYRMKLNNSSTSFSGRYLYAAGSGSPASGTETNYAGPVPGATSTTSTFGNVEIYIPNYAGSTNKSFSVDAVAENNATLAEMALYAGLWSNTSAINQITITPNASSFLQYSTAYLYGVSNA